MSKGNSISNSVSTVKDELASAAAAAPAVVSKVQDAVSGTLRQSADVVSATSERLAGQEAKLRGFGKQAATSLRNSADYVDEFDPARVKADLSNAARSHMGVSLVAAGVAGLALGLLFGRLRS